MHRCRVVFGCINNAFLRGKTGIGLLLLLPALRVPFNLSPSTFTLLIMPAHDYSDSDDERPSAGPSISTDSEPVSLPPKSTGPRVKLTVGDLLIDY